MIPTTPALTAEVAKLTDRMRPYIHRPDEAIAKLLRLQYEAIVRAPSVTKADNAPVVLRTEDYPHLDRSRHLNHGCHDDGPPEAA